MTIRRSEKMLVMQREYGFAKDGKQQCNKCCNCQQAPSGSRTRICVAFGVVDHFDCTWEPYQRGCGIYNVPFLALRPRRRPLIEVFGPRPPKEESEQPPEQMGLFG